MATLKPLVRFTMLRKAKDSKLLKRTASGKKERAVLAARTKHYRKTEGRETAKKYHYGLH